MPERRKYFLFPLSMKPPLDSTTSAPLLDRCASPPLEPARVLIVDDVPANVRLLSGILKIEGFEILTASSGAEALEAIAQAAPDVVLLDVMMPGMDGFEVCRRIRAEPSTCVLPVVMVTALQDVEDRVRALEAGADDFLSKPVDDVEVVARVRSLARAKRDRDALGVAYRDLREVEAARESLAAALVHDLRTPLTTMLAALDMLLPENGLSEHGLDALQGEVVGMCSRSAHRLLGMVNQILDVARLEGGEMPLHLESVPARRLLDDALEEAAQSNSARVLVEAEDVLVRADADVARRVLVNLLSNALKFTRASGEVRVSARAQAGEVVFAVADQGPGVAPEEHERIFDKFAQVRGLRENRRGSSGVGLFFCRLAVEAHGGRAWLESEVGQGSTFFFSLPGASQSE